MEWLELIIGGFERKGGFRGRNYLPRSEQKTYFAPSTILGVGSSMVEQRPFKSLVPGSNPGQPTTIRGKTQKAAGTHPRLVSKEILHLCLYSLIVSRA
jgi:hypothetical protein